MFNNKYFYRRESIDVLLNKKEDDEIKREFNDKKKKKNYIVSLVNFISSRERGLNIFFPFVVL